jgi:hypothetical protein
VSPDEITHFLYFLMRRLSIENRTPSHPDQYDQIILSSALLSEDIVNRVFEQDCTSALNQESSLIDEDEGAPNLSDLYNSSRVKLTFLKLLCSICNNDPS